MKDHKLSVDLIPDSVWTMRLNHTSFFVRKSCIFESLTKSFSMSQDHDFMSGLCSHGRTTFEGHMEFPLNLTLVTDLIRESDQC